MPQLEIEVILMRQLASCLALPIVVVDPKGDLIYFNEAAEPIFGRRFEEMDRLRRGEWSKTLRPMTEGGTPIAREDQPITIATDRRQPAYRRAWVRGYDGVSRLIEGLAFPLSGHGERFVGAVGIFWEVEQPQADESTDS
jgi:PAS domain-containing protein